MSKKKLKLQRNKLDKLDEELLNLIKKRTEIIKEVIKLKAHKKQIVDHNRIKKVLGNIRIKSLRKNIDPKITKRIWTTMIWSYINYERRNFNKIHKKIK